MDYLDHPYRPILWAIRYVPASLVPCPYDMQQKKEFLATTSLWVSSVYALAPDCQTRAVMIGIADKVMTFLRLHISIARRRLAKDFELKKPQVFKLNTHRTLLAPVISAGIEYF